MDPQKIDHGKDIDPNTGNFITESENSSIDPEPNELEVKYKQLYEFAKGQKFARLFRGEGSRDLTSPMDRMATGDHGLTGKYWTENYAKAARYKHQAGARSETAATIYSVIVPRSVIDMQDPDDKAQDQVLFNPHPDCTVINVEDQAGLPEPNLDNFMDQFSFVREYRRMQGKQMESK